MHRVCRKIAGQRNALMERKQQTGAPFNSAPFRLRRVENSGQNNLAASRNEVIRRREALEQMAKGMIVC